MKNWITILLTLIVLISYGQNKQPKELGIGFVIAANPYAFDDLSSPTNLFMNKELTEKWTSNKIFPHFYKPDYGLYHFICLEKTDNFYKVLVNDIEIVYLPNNTDYYFKTWDSILLNSTLERLTNDNPIRAEWNDKSEIITNNCELDRLTVEDLIQIQGEYWVQIYFSPNCEVYLEKDLIVKYGWIKWRTDDKLLVDILLLN